MKIRARFSKEGRIKFIGHLDLLRLFQRVIKSAQIPIAYSQGFNPHSLLYFAQPLSVGVTSTGEYMDMHLEKEMDSQWIQNKMNLLLPEGLKIESVFILPDDSKAAMTLIDAADYLIRFPKEGVNEQFINMANDFYSQQEILVTRISKKKEKIINIKEFIYDFRIMEEEGYYSIKVILAAGSRKNLNPDLFIAPFIEKMDSKVMYHIHRVDLLSLNNDKLISLSQLGE